MTVQRWVRAARRETLFASHVRLLAGWLRVGLRDPASWRLRAWECRVSAGAGRAAARQRRVTHLEACGADSRPVPDDQFQRRETAGHPGLRTRWFANSGLRYARHRGGSLPADEKIRHQSPGTGGIRHGQDGQASKWKSAPGVGAGYCRRVAPWSPTNGALLLAWLYPSDVCGSPAEFSVFW